MSRTRLLLLLFPLIVAINATFADDTQTASVPPVETLCRVLEVHDGDTLRVKCRTGIVRVRLPCIDAPELEQAPWAEQSRDALRAMLPPTVSIRVHSADRYGRFIAEPASPWSTADPPPSLRMVETGQAAVYREYCTDRRYDAAERQARERQLGIWSAPGEQQTPWIVRHRLSGRR